MKSLLAMTLAAMMLAGCTQILPIGSKPERSFSLRYDGTDADVMVMKSGPVVFFR